MVVDVEEYPQFVPFCTGCTIAEQVELTEEEAEWILANQECSLLFASTSIGFKAFSETYLSRIKCTPNLRIEAYSTDSRLFERMVSIWEFKEVAGRPDCCEIVFYSEFGFKSALYSQIAGYFLEYVSNHNMEAFVSRLHSVYEQHNL